MLLLEKYSQPVVAILAEYDALVGLGHACGHNLIAGAAVGAGFALAALKPRSKDKYRSLVHRQKKEMVAKLY